MFKTLYLLIRSIRPRQWVKNMAVFAAIVFSGDLFIPGKVIPVFYTFLIFNMAVSVTYLINDIADAKKDRLHYFKKNRPLAKGELKISTAAAAAVILAIGALIWSYSLSTHLFWMVVIFMLLEGPLYSFFLKKVILIDVITIAAGFMVRIFAGSFVVSTSFSSWLILTTMMLALFLAIGKRRLEATLLSKVIASKHRDTLSHYPTVLLDGLTFMMANSTLLTYSLFTFNEPELGNKVYFSFLPSTVASPKWLMATIPIVVYGIFRYLYLIYDKGEGEAPERVLLKDKPLLFTVLFWGFSILFVVYILGK